MTGSLDTTLQDTAFAICDDVGKKYDLIIQQVETYNPDTGAVGGLTTTTKISIIASPPLNFDERIIDESLIRQGDVKIIVPFKQSSTLNLNSSYFSGFKKDSPGQRWTFDYHDWTTVAISTIYSGAEVCAYEFQLRK